MSTSGLSLDYLKSSLRYTLDLLGMSQYRRQESAACILRAKAAGEDLSNLKVLEGTLKEDYGTHWRKMCELLDELHIEGDFMEHVSEEFLNACTDAGISAFWEKPGVPGVPRATYNREQELNVNAAAQKIYMYALELLEASKRS